MANNQNMRNAQFNRILQCRQTIRVLMHNQVRDIAVDKQLPRWQPHNFVGRHAAIGTPNPVKRRRLLSRQSLEKFRVAGKRRPCPIFIAPKEIFKKSHMRATLYNSVMPQLLWLTFILAASLPAAGAQARQVDVRILSTMLADDAGYGEWGFAALVTVDGHKILFDTGAHPDTVLRNAKLLNIDLATASDVILSHNHLDHTAGLMTLRNEFKKSGGLARAHVGQGIFLPRVRKDGTVINAMATFKREYEATGGTFITYDQPREIRPGVWLTGPVPRAYPEKNWSGALQIKAENGTLSEDNLPEDQSLVIDTGKGLVVISGCGHAGVVNTLQFARAKIRQAPIHAAIGGFHLYAASDDHLAWTASKLKEFGLQQLLGAHCTGIEAVYRLRELTGLNRKTAAVGALGGGFDLEKGISPGSISR